MESKEESVNKLAAALAKTQGEIQAAIKTQENTFFSKGNKKSTYADIADVIEAIQKPAAANGLSVLFNYKSEAQDIFIRYQLMHSSGESLVSEWLMMFLKDKSAHGFGASNTYYKRQLLKGIYQIPEEDDDGNAASGKITQNGITYPQSSTQPPPEFDSSEDLDSAFGTISDIKGAENTKNVFLPGDHFIEFGYNRGKPIKSISDAELKKTIAWAEAQPKAGVGLLTTVKMIKEYLRLKEINGTAKG